MNQVILINDTAEVGGAEVNLMLIASNLIKYRWKPVVITGKDGPLVQRLAENGLPVQFLPGCPNWSVSFYVKNWRKFPNPAAWAANLLTGAIWCGKIRRFLEQYPKAVIHTNGIFSHLFGGLAARLAGRPVVWHFQDIVERNSGAGIYNKILQLAARYLPDQIVCISSQVADQFSKEEQISSKIQIVENTVDLDRFFPDCKRTEDDSRLLIIGTAARLTPWKGQEVALEAARILKEQGVSFHWYFAGDEALGSSRYKQHLMELIEQWNLKTEVDLLGWVADMAGFYHSLDLLVHIPLEPEPYGLVLAEAAACGLPVITTPGGAAEQLVRNQAGILVEPGRPEPVAESAAWLEHHPADFQSYRQNAREYAERTFGLETFMKKITGVYQAAWEAKYGE